MDREIRKDEDYRALPSVGGLLGSDEGLRLKARYGVQSVTNAIREAIEKMKKSGEIHGDKESNVIKVLAIAGRSLAGEHGALTPVINATGVVLHTNLGRAPLSAKAISAAASAAFGYSDLEYDLMSGKRGSRQSHGAYEAARLIGAEAALIVNNNAAAVLLCLDALAKGAKVAVSRGELVEIGGSFRVPDIMSATGAILLEVGTTNRTRPSDFEKAAEAGASALLKVHPSNFRITGFVSEAGVPEMAEIARKHRIPLIFDIGSGAMVPMSRFGLPEEPMPKEAIMQGADIVTFSGDKLFGGPQCGIIAGRKDLVSIISKSPLARAFRVDKMRLAAICATLSHYSNEDGWKDIPVLRMLSAGEEQLREKAAKLKGLIEGGLAGKAEGIGLEEVVTEDEVGGGSVPGGTLKGAGLKVSAKGLNSSELAERLRKARKPVVAMEKGPGILLSLRTVDDTELLGLSESVIDALTGGKGI